MADKDAPYKLFGQVVMDDFYIGASTENGKWGRGTDKNQVLVALSKNSKGDPLHVEMEVIEDIKGSTVIELVTKMDLGTIRVSNRCLPFISHCTNKGLQTGSYVEFTKLLYPNLKDNTVNIINKWVT